MRSLGNKIKQNLKTTSDFLREEGSKLPKPVWLGILILPGGLEFLAGYLIVRSIIRRNKK